jgi:hypothetical protein
MAFALSNILTNEIREHRLAPAAGAKVSAITKSPRPRGDQNVLSSGA